MTDHPDAPAPGSRAPAESGTTHELKVWPRYAAALDSGVKTFECRLDDRRPPFAVGDTLRLREYTPERERYTGREWHRRVTYVARGGVIPVGYCVMAIVPPAASPSPAGGELWMVIRKRETDPVEVWTGAEAEMRSVYDRAQAQWSDTFLTRVVSGPRDVLNRAASPSPAGGTLKKRCQWCEEGYSLDKDGNHDTTPLGIPFRCPALLAGSASGDFATEDTLADALKVLLSHNRNFGGEVYRNDPEYAALVSRSIDVALQEVADLRAQLAEARERADKAERAIQAACEIIELGDQRLLAQDGPVGNQPPALTLKEWRTLYTTLDDARPKNG